MTPKREILLPEKYADELEGVLECWDRIVMKGHLQPLSYSKGMTGFLYRNGILIFDYGEFTKPLRDELRQNARALASENGLEIEYIGKAKGFRKEARIQEILDERGDAPGLVHIFSAMETCPSYYPWHDKENHKTYVKSKPAKCLHYYFYFIDEALGLCYMRVPTWCPFGLQFYCNGHNWLAAQLTQRDIGFVMQDNAFVQIDDFDQANQIVQELDAQWLEEKVQAFAQLYCPVGSQLGLTYHWTIWQAEYATDLVFKQQSTLQAFYPHLLETLITTVKPVNIATFLGRKLHGKYQGEMGNRYNVRLEGTRIRHQMGPVSIKMYDKFQHILRLETTVNDVAFFKLMRPVQHRDGSTSTQLAPMKKHVSSLPALQQQLQQVNQRYLTFISAVETPEVGVTKLQQLTETRHDKQHRYKGFNLLSEEDSSILRLLVRGEFLIDGLSNKALRTLLPHKSSGQISRLLKRFRVHGLIKKGRHRYKYFITAFGRQVLLMALKVRDLFIIPQFAQ